MFKNVSFRLLCLLVILAFTIASCGGGTPKLEDQIIGQWQYTDPDIEIPMTFDFQKDGKLAISAEGITIDATYTWIDADTINLVLSFGDESEESSADVVITGDTLTLTMEGVSQEMTRVK